MQEVWSLGNNQDVNIICCTAATDLEVKGFLAVTNEKRRNKIHFS